MVEYNEKWLDSYKEHRPNSIHIINDATKIDYLDLFSKNNVPNDIDYLQIDLEVEDGGTLNTLIKLNETIMDKYRFATVTFEHDVYQSNYLDTRLESRKIFESRGYLRVFDDVSNCECPYEDWYVHPDLVDMNLIAELKNKNNANYIKTHDYPHLHECYTLGVKRIIPWKRIQY